MDKCDAGWLSRLMETTNGKVIVFTTSVGKLRVIPRSAVKHRRILISRDGERRLTTTEWNERLPALAPTTVGGEILRYALSSCAFTIHDPSFTIAQDNEEVVWSDNLETDIRALLDEASAQLDEASALRLARSKLTDNIVVSDPHHRWLGESRSDEPTARAAFGPLYGHVRIPLSVLLPWTAHKAALMAEEGHRDPELLYMGSDGDKEVPCVAWDGGRVRSVHVEPKYRATDGVSEAVANGMGLPASVDAAPALPSITLEADRVDSDIPFRLGLADNLRLVSPGSDDVPVKMLVPATQETAEGLNRVGLENPLETQGLFPANGRSLSVLIRTEDIVYAVAALDISDGLFEFDLSPFEPTGPRRFPYTEHFNDEVVRRHLAAHIAAGPVGARYDAAARAVTLIREQAENLTSTADAVDALIGDHGLDAQAAEEIQGEMRAMAQRLHTLDSRELLAPSAQEPEADGPKSRRGR